MYVCYVDESGDPGTKGSEYLLLGAAALFEGRWRYVRDDLDNLLLKHFPPPATLPLEIHMAELRRGKGAFRGLSAAQRVTLANDLCSVAAHNLPSELRFFTIVAHKPTWFANNPGRTGDDLYAALFDREPLTSAREPGKWHGVKCLCGHPATRAMLNRIWAQGAAGDAAGL